MTIYISVSVLPVILEMQIYLVNWFHNLVSLQICSTCKPSSLRWKLFGRFLFSMMFYFLYSV
jgi:hypothetical protein